MSKTYKDISVDFEQAVQQIQKDLQYLVDKGKVSKGFIKKQNRILKALIYYYNHTQEQITFYKSELINTQKANGLYREKLEHRIIQFEAICIMHGIIDFPRFIALPQFVLIDWAKRLNNENRFLYSDMQIDFFKELPTDKGILLENILFKNVRDEINSQLKKIKNNKILKDGIRI